MGRESSDISKIAPKVKQIIIFHLTDMISDVFHCSRLEMNATSASTATSQGPPHFGGGGGPNSLPGGPSHFRPLGPRLSGPTRPPRPLFVREIYKNGFLKRLPYNEKKSSALSKLMKTDR